MIDNEQRNECLLFNIGAGLKFPHIQKAVIAEHWERYGGSFLKGLAKALYAADINNEKIIRDNWSHYIKEDLDILLQLENSKW